jgi:hypothetical protein
MVSGTEIEVYYGVNLEQESYDKVCEKLPMKYSKDVKRVITNGRWTYFIGIQLKENFNELNKITVPKVVELYKKDLQDLLNTFQDDKVDKDILIHKIDVLKQVEYESDNKFVKIYNKVKRYAPDHHKYMGLTTIDLKDIEKYYNIDATSLKSEFNVIAEPFGSCLGYLNPECYVYAYDF